MAAKPVRPAIVGDRVILMWERNFRPLDLVGWVLNINEDIIRISSSADDDGRPDTPSHPLPTDWWRTTKPLSEVSVIPC